MSLWHPNKPLFPSAHASTHETGGSDKLVDFEQLKISGTSVITSSRVLQNITMDASLVSSGRFTMSRIPTSSTANRFLVVRTADGDPTYDSLTSTDIPSLPRTKISDFWSSPFWDSIPDKPSTFTPSSHNRTAHTISLIPTSTSDPSASQGDIWFRTDTNQLRIYTTSVKQVFPADWSDITSKPSSFTPSAHASSHASGGSDQLSLSASQITSGTLSGIGGNFSSATLIIECRTSDPTSPETGRIWLRTDL